MSRNLPNQITALRLLLAIFFFMLLAQYSQRDPKPWMLDVATIVFIVAAITDVLDGYVARKYGLSTPLGRVLDPVVDKVLVCGAFILLAGPSFVDSRGVNVSGVAAWMVVVIVGRELLVTAIRGYGESTGMQFGASVHGKVKMWTQSVAAPALLLLMSRGESLFSSDAVEWIKTLLIWTTVIVTLLSMVQYVARSRRLLTSGASS